MKLLITGGKGMLGRTLQKELKEFDIVVADLPEADITDRFRFAELLQEIAPDTVIHCAAMTAVDECETDTEKAFALNASGSANVAWGCMQQGCRLIAISTDYVFDGTQDRPYSEFDQADGGESIYGQSKFAGEETIRLICPDHVICRTAWLYGAGGPSFVHTMMKLAGTQPQLKVVADQIGNPTSCLAVARQLRNIINRRELTGTFHMTCEGEASWADFAEEIFRLAKADQKIQRCTTADFPRPAPRPANSRLENMRMRLNHLPSMPHWKEALAEFMETERF